MAAKGGRLGKPIFGGSIKNNLDVGQAPYLPDGIGLAREATIPPQVSRNLGDDLYSEQETERVNRSRAMVGKGPLRTDKPSKSKVSTTHQVPPGAGGKNTPPQPR